MDNLYESIEALCNQRGIRPGRLCNDLGLSRGLITDLKMGRKKSVNAETAQKIAAYFGISVSFWDRRTMAIYLIRWMWPFTEITRN